MHDSRSMVRSLTLSLAVLSAACNSPGGSSSASAGGSSAATSTSGAKAAASTQIVPAAPQAPKSATPIVVTSQTFQAGGTIPATASFNGFGCTGGNVSPQLSWSGAPPETKSFALTLWDPDAPTGVGFSHWVVFNISAKVTGLAAGAGKSASPGGGVGGYGDVGTHTYTGPCPPPGDAPHRYRFTVSALDVDSLQGAGPGTTLATVTFMMRGHLLAQGTLEGRFGR